MRTSTNTDVITKGMRTSTSTSTNTDVITTGGWVIVYLIMCIPLINIIMLFVWAFGGGTPASKANWAKASLIWLAIVFILTLLVLTAST